MSGIEATNADLFLDNFDDEEGRGVVSIMISWSFLVGTSKPNFLISFLYFLLVPYSSGKWIFKKSYCVLIYFYSPISSIKL